MKNRNQSFINLSVFIMLVLVSVLVISSLSDKGSGAKLQSAQIKDRVSYKYINKSVNHNPVGQPVEKPIDKPLIGKSGFEEGSANVVTSIVVNYRMFDTLGEILVLFSSAAVLSLLIGKRKKRNLTEPSAILKTAIPLINILVFTVGAYVVLHGHLGPGGGFAGGSIIASGLIFTMITFMKKKSTSWYLLLEALCGLSILTVGMIGLLKKGSLFANFLGNGTIGSFLSGGTGLVLYILIGIKVMAEIINIAIYMVYGKGDSV